MFKLNIEKAKDLHRTRIRQSRTERFKVLDTEFMKALELGDTAKVAEISATKQELRDLPACEEIQNASTLDDLKNHWPDILDCDNFYRHNK